MKYGELVGGVPEINVPVTLQFSAEEIEEIKRIAKICGYESWRDWIKGHAEGGVVAAMGDPGVWCLDYDSDPGRKQEEN
jgi:hypothetical protein